MMGIVQKVQIYSKYDGNCSDSTDMLENMMENVQNEQIYLKI